MTQNTVSEGGAMSRYFRLAEEAKNHGVMMTGASPKTTSLVEDDALKVQSALGFLSDSTTPEDRKRIEKDMQGQKGYRF
ncbi:MAG: hypothetical protein Q8P56_04380, partial [Candidatus Uhrbacteria bacterium]|nr:hypothetical protein [Candidatus Uhrbacteria bacterium]